MRPPDRRRKSEIQGSEYLQVGGSLTVFWAFKVSISLSFLGFCWCFVLAIGRAKVCRLDFLVLLVFSESSKSTAIIGFGFTNISRWVFPSLRVLADHWVYSTRPFLLPHITGFNHYTFGAHGVFLVAVCSALGTIRSQNNIACILYFENHRYHAHTSHLFRTFSVLSGPKSWINVCWTSETTT
jgi:hypothetical protein